MKTIIVQPGDTLWHLAGQHLGDNYRWTTLFWINEREIRKEQRRRGIYPDVPENWIFPGTTLYIPCIKGDR